MLGREEVWTGNMMTSLYLSGQFVSAFPYKWRGSCWKTLGVFYVWLAYTFNKNPHFLFCPFFFFLNVLGLGARLTPVILGTQMAEIKRVVVRSQLWQIVPETLSWKHPNTERVGGVSQVVELLPSKLEALIKPCYRPLPTKKSPQVSENSYFQVPCSYSYSI
jgi:hypothetical protein